ncbi:MAG: hypothetical protein M3Z14_01835 [Candidatus Eremiobacteraeota bacterium]|nr:hypothetical protein [Candidatus Eremiobacteraeota bacterium]
MSHRVVLDGGLLFLFSGILRVMNDPINPDSTEESPPPNEVPGQPEEYETDPDSEALPEG